MQNKHSSVIIPAVWLVISKTVKSENSKHLVSGFMKKMMQGLSMHRVLNKF